MPPGRMAGAGRPASQARGARARRLRAKKSGYQRSFFMTADIKRLRGSLGGMLIGRSVSANPSAADLRAWIDQRSLPDAQIQQACHELARAAARVEMWGVRPTQGHEPRSFIGGEHGSPPVFCAPCCWPLPTACTPCSPTTASTSPRQATSPHRHRSSVRPWAAARSSAPTPSNSIAPKTTSSTV